MRTQEEEGAREWMFMEVGKIAKITEKGGEVEIKSEKPLIHMAEISIKSRVALM